MLPALLYNNDLQLRDTNLRIPPSFKSYPNYESFLALATVKGLFNPTAANIIINPLPGGSSRQRYTNGLLYQINQVLSPAPL